MQILKEENNSRILSAALKEFELHGYSQSSMRRIATAAGMTTGNIYRYYDSKDSLYQELIGPTYLKFTHFILMIQKEIDHALSSSSKKPERMELVDDTFQQLIHFLEESSVEAKILLTLSHGSVYEHAKQELIDIVRQIFESIAFHGEENASELKKVKLNVFAATLIEGVCITLQNVSERDQIRYTIYELATLIGKSLKCG